jgi:hypothetical protein
MRKHPAFLFASLKTNLDAGMHSFNRGHATTGFALHASAGKAAQ